VHVPADRETGHSDERDRLTARDAFADGDEHDARVVVARLETRGVLDAHADPTLAVGLPSGLRDCARISGDDDRAERRRDIDTAVRWVHELRDRAGDRADETSGPRVDLRETVRERDRYSGGITTHDLVAAEGGVHVVVAIGPHGPAEETAVRAEAPHPEEVREDRRRRRPRRPDRARFLVHVARGDGRAWCPHEQRSSIGGP